MLDFLAHGIISILTVYLSLTNSLADVILQQLSPEEPTAEYSSVNTEKVARVIPDILLNNPTFQQAAVIDSHAGISSSDIRATLVNIFCTYDTDEYRRQTTGSGFLVSEDGVVLTNAHVAQFLLLAELKNQNNAECIIRTGEPAVATYKADLLYISPYWIQENANQIAAAEPKGTGERDYALLYIDKSINNSPLPAKFPFLNVDTALVSKNIVGDEATIAGYPALAHDNELTVTQSVATTKIFDIYTFDTNYGDIFLLGGTQIGTNGISGGPLINQNDQAIGMISTRGNDAMQGAGSLNAITTSYIDRTMREETGFGFTTNISGNLPARSTIFKQILIPFLASQLQAEL